MQQTCWSFGVPKQEDDFKRFWEIYPRKVGKPRAQVLFKRLKASEPHAIEPLLEGVQKYAKDVKARDVEDVYILHPSTFLNQRRWEDETVNKKEPEKSPAEVEWEALLKYTAQHGRYGTSPLPISKRGLEVLREIGGYTNVCNSTDAGIKKLRKLFLEIY